MIDEPHDDAPEDEGTPDEPAAEGSPDEPAAGEASADEPVAEAEADQPVADEPAADEPVADQPVADEPAPEAVAEPVADEPAPADAVAEDAAAADAVAEDAAADDAAAADEPAADEAPQTAKAPKPRPKRDRKQGDDDEPEVIPGAHLEPDLVLEEPTGDEGALGGLADAEFEPAEQALEEDGDAAADGGDSQPTPRPMPTTVLELAADARYRATGKRKRAVARVTLKPGTGSYTVNGRELDAFFPRATLQTIARQPLVAVGQAERMDVVAKIHGGGVSAQAGALRHGIARALVEADPNLRGELKSRGFLTRDARVKERKKAGLKKARKRPQFSKR